MEVEAVLRLDFGSEGCIGEATDKLKACSDFYEQLTQVAEKLGVLKGAAFREMDLIWRDIMQKVKAQTHIITVAGFHNLLGDLQSANEQLDVVEKGLNAFLNTKKMAFPRFFFLSNDELLEILSEGKIPKNVQPFVKKCFESMKDLNFNDEQGGSSTR